VEDAVADEPMDPRVDVYIEKAAPFAQPVLAHLRKLMHQACPRATESVKWGMPFFLQQGVILAHMAAFKQHCAFGFWGKDMTKVLAKDGLKRWGSGEGMGSLGRIIAMKDLPPDKVLLAYMRQAGELVESGQRTKSIERTRKPVKRPLTIPPELTAALKKNKRATKAFEVFSPGCRREYAEWIAEAKRPGTKEKRVAQAISWIAEGKSRNWKYQNC
jgi:uncharacterized protein YdeI (YjbR/CyaY-like superfamily)